MERKVILRKNLLDLPRSPYCVDADDDADADGSGKWKSWLSELKKQAEQQLRRWS